MKVRTIALIAALALLAAGCGGDSKPADNASTETTADTTPAGPQTYTVAVDAGSPKDKNIQLGTYFPPSVKARPGDTIIFDNQSSQAPHTISFGIEGTRANSPPLVTKDFQYNPAVFGPCFTADPATPNLEACPTSPAGAPPPFTGKGYWNSGALVPTVAPPEAPHQVKVVLDSSIPPATYSYACLLHPNMAGAVVVSASGADTPEGVTQSAAKFRDAAVAAAAQMAEAPPTSTEGNSVVAGWGDKVVAVNQFSPAELEIKVGQVVKWTAFSPYEPHTVTFESPFTNPEDPKAFPPGGVKSGGSYTGGFANSGFIGSAETPFNSKGFSLKFTKKGDYKYICVLHPGMAGAVKVT